MAFTRDPAATFASRLDDLAAHLGDSASARAEVEAVRAIVAGVDEAAIAGLRARHAAEIAAASRKGEHKYLDIVFFVHAKLRLARELGLDRTPAPLDILDIGSGAGHFALVCRGLGHRVTALDIPNPVYDVAAPALGVERIMHRLEPGAGLPGLGRRFDLVTAMAVNFSHRAGPGEAPAYWTLDEWRPLLSDLVERHTRRPGRIWMRLNCEDRPEGAVYNPEVMDLAAASGARIERDRGVIDWRLDG